MKKLFLFFIIVVLFFGGLVYAAFQVDWGKLLGNEKVTDNIEAQLGDMFWSMYGADAKEIDNKERVDSVRMLINRICRANGIDEQQIKLHVIENREINAFALPDHHMVVHTGLLDYAAHEQEVAGVLAHEIAHMELKHVLKKLGKEIGLSVLINIAAGDIGGEVIKEGIRTLSSSAYDRSLEKKADLQAVQYLMAAKMDPSHFAGFLDRLSKGGSTPQVLSWMSTHPDSKERAMYILEEMKALSKDK